MTWTCVLASGIDAGKVQVQYQVLNFLDSSSTTSYSTRSANALAVVLDTSGPRSRRSSTTCSTRTSRGGQRGSQRRPAASPTRCRPGRRRSDVASGISGRTYEQWVKNGTEQASKDKVQLHPTVRIDGKRCSSRRSARSSRPWTRPPPGRPEPGVGTGAAPARLTPMPDASTPSPYAAFVAGLPKAEIHVHHVGSASPRIVSELAARHPGAGAARPRRAARLLHVPRLRALHRGLPRRRRPAPRARGHPAADLRGRHRHGRAEHPLRRADAAPRGPRCRPASRSRRTSRPSRTRGSPPSATTASRLRWIYDIPGESGLPAAEDTLRLRPAPRPGDADRLRPRRPRGGRRPAAVQGRASTRPGPPGCTACRTPGRRPARRPSGTRSATSAPSASGTAPPRCRTRSCSPTSSSTGSRSRSARPPTSRPARSTCWRTTRSGRCTTPGVLVTVNSDDPPMFGTTLNREYEIAADLLDLDERGIAAAREERRRRPRSCPTPDKARAGRRDRRLHRGRHRLSGPPPHCARLTLLGEAGAVRRSCWAWPGPREQLTGDARRASFRQLALE